MSDYIIFIGAGASAPFGVPTMTQIVEDIEERYKNLATLQAEVEQIRGLYFEIKRCLSRYEGYDIEAVITVLRDMVNPELNPAQILNTPSIHYFSSWISEIPAAFDKLIKWGIENAAEKRPIADRLFKDIKRFIIDRCFNFQKRFDIYDEFFIRVMKRHGFDYQSALEGKQRSINCIIFTTNYDTVLEAYCNYRGLELECGQEKNMQLKITRKENQSLYDPDASSFMVLKLHGPVNWCQDEQGNMYYLSQLVEPGKRIPYSDKTVNELLLYPAVGKSIFIEPFYSMFTYLYERLLECSTCYIIGYSFRYDDILGLFHNAMELNNKLALVFIDRCATGIVEDKFTQFQNRIKPIEANFSVDVAKELA